MDKKTHISSSRLLSKSLLVQAKTSSVVPSIFLGSLIHMQSKSVRENLRFFVSQWKCVFAYEFNLIYLIFKIFFWSDKTTEEH
jgi:hypothetical protein